MVFGKFNKKSSSAKSNGSINAKVNSLSNIRYEPGGGERKVLIYQIHIWYGNFTYRKTTEYGTIYFRIQTCISIYRKYSIKPPEDYLSKVTLGVGAYSWGEGGGGGGLFQQQPKILVGIFFLTILIFTWGWPLCLEQQQACKSVPSRRKSE